MIIPAGLGQGTGSPAEAAERAARKYGMRLIGPNCLGILMPGVNLNASFSAHMPVAGNLALISQSGAIATGMVDWAAQRAVGFSGIVSIGDQLDVDIADLLGLLRAGRQDARHPALCRSDQGRPQVHVRGARRRQDQAGRRRQIRPHGAGGKGGGDPYRRAGRFGRGLRCRVPSRRDPAGVGSCANCSTAPRRWDASSQPPGKRLAILTNGGGIGVLAIDRLVELGGIPAPITPATREKLNAILPPTWSGSNPIDIVGDADARALCGGARGVAGRPGQRRDPGHECSDRDRPGRRHRRDRDRHRQASTASSTAAPAKPVLAVWVGADQKTIDMLSDAGIPNYPTEDDAVRGFMHLVQHREVVTILAQVPPAMPSEFVPDIECGPENRCRSARRWPPVA